MQLPKKEVLTKGMFPFYEYDMKELFEQNNTPQKYWYITRVSEIIEVIRKNIDTDGKILDVGCAQGNVPLILSKYGYNSAYGVDMRYTALGYAKLKTEKENASFITGSSEGLPFRNSTFDCVILAELLEHLAFPEITLSEAKRVLKGDGIIIITTPNRRKKRKTRSYSESRELNNTQLEDRKFGIDTHVFEFENQELINLLKHTGLNILFHKKLSLANIIRNFPVLLLLETAFKKGISPLRIRKIDDFFAPYFSVVPYLGGLTWGTIFVICGKTKKNIKKGGYATFQNLYDFSIHQR